MYDCQRKFSIENYRRENTLNVARSHKKKQEGNAQAALYEKRESVKLKEDSMTLTCCTYTDSLELELA